MEVTDVSTTSLTDLDMLNLDTVSNRNIKVEAVASKVPKLVAATHITDLCENKD